MPALLEVVLSLPLCAQEEFGPLQRHSQAEIAEMLAAQNVSPDIQELLDRRWASRSYL